jgi:hypothetical protein
VLADKRTRADEKDSESKQVSKDTSDLFFTAVGPAYSKLVASAINRGPESELDQRPRSSS